MADRFATRPSDWMRWLSESLPIPLEAAESKRRLLVRRCYLNPQVFQRFRPAFNRSGFEIVDCPAMTSTGKTSTDVHMVLDIVELLQHPVHYDEFIVFSADADFTPVLRKLRRWDRRTTVLAIGFPSAAYQASADLLIDEGEFIRGALGVEEIDEVPPTPPDPPRIPQPASDAGARNKAVAEMIRSEVAASDQPVSCARVAQRLGSVFPGLAGDWGGQATFRKFVDSLDLGPLVVDWSSAGGVIVDPRRGQCSPAARDSIVEGGTEVEGLIRQVAEVSGAPLLTAEEHVALFEAIAGDLAVVPFNLRDTGKRVRDHCRRQGWSVSRDDVNFVLRGLLIAGHEFGRGEDSPAALARAHARNVLHLCEREQLGLDALARDAVARWIAGSAPDAAASVAAVGESV